MITAHRRENLGEPMHNMFRAIRRVMDEHPDANLSEGCIVRAMAVVGRYVTLERACIVNVGGLIDHHCTLGEGTHVLMGAVVRNKVCVPPETWIASNQVFE